MQLAPLKPEPEKKAKTSAIAQVLDVKEGPRGFWDVLFWWEKRRPLYNFLVGATGLPAFLWLNFHDGSSSVVWVLGAVAYGIAANLCYSVGWIAELIALRHFKEKATYFGSICFALGTGFSIILTLIMSVLCGFYAHTFSFGG
jgi:hypothetical protein